MAIHTHPTEDFLYSDDLESFEAEYAEVCDVQEFNWDDFVQWLSQQGFAIVQIDNQRCVRIK